jgi:acyl carrier protein
VPLAAAVQAAADVGLRPAEALRQARQFPAGVWRVPDTPAGSGGTDHVVVDLGLCLTPEGLATALADAWCRGVEVDWRGYHAGESPHRVPLPTYPFDSTRHWVDPDPPAPADPAGVPSDPATDWDAELDRMLADGVDPVVATVAGVWQEVLGVPSVAGADDFFALGGDSLRLLRATGRLRELFDLDVPLAEAFRARTLDQLVGLLEDLVTREPAR